MCDDVLKNGIHGVIEKRVSKEWRWDEIESLFVISNISDKNYNKSLCRL